MKESLQLRSWNLNSTSNPPVAPRRLSFQISANQRKAETSANVNKHWKTRGKGNDVITNVISANRHFASTFSTQIFKFQRRSCKLSFLFPPCRQSAPESLLAGYKTPLCSCTYITTFTFFRIRGATTRCTFISLIHDTRHLCMRLMTDGIKAMSRGKQVIKFASATNHGEVSLF